MAKKSQIPPHWQKGLNSFENLQVVVVLGCCNRRYLILIGLFLRKIRDKNKNWSSLNGAKVRIFVGNFNIVQLLTLVLCQNYEQSNLLAQRISSSRSRKLSVFVGWNLFTIVPFHGTNSLSVKCLLTGDWTRNRLKFFSDRNWFFVFQEKLRPANSSVPPNVIFK